MLIAMLDCLDSSNSPTLMWLINISHFVTNPQSIVPTLAILLVGLFALKAFRKRAQEIA